MQCHYIHRRAKMKGERGIKKRPRGDLGRSTKGVRHINSGTVPKDSPPWLKASTILQEALAPPVQFYR